MKYLMLMVMSLVFTASAFAHDVYVHGYTRSNGAYVEGYHRTSPDNTVNNNYGTQGNVNPYNGAYGTQPRRLDEPQGQYNQGNGQGGISSTGYGVYQNAGSNDNE